MATMESRMGSMPQPYTSLPASPTLTNPDMILPDYPDYDRSASPDLADDMHSQSSLLMWKNPHDSSSSAGLQQLFSGVHAFPSAPNTPTTPIIYGNGTMLSDIGEVTEVESTPGRPSPTLARRRAGGAAGAAGGSAAAASPSSSRSPSPSPLPQHLRRQFDRDDYSATPRASSPTVGADDAGNSSAGTVHAVGVNGGGGGVKQRARQQQKKLATGHMRHDSIDSNSTITTQDQAGLFADFDDAASVGDSVFQGDDEESVAEFYAEEPFSPREVHSAIDVGSSSLLAVPSLAGRPGSGHTSDEDDRRHSTASISRRAEEILANAKRRLTTMEDNLSRARNTLHASSPSPGSVPSDGSTPSPKTPVRSATAFADTRPYDTTYRPRHTRLGSDGAKSPDGTDVLNTLLPRSASALGAAGGYRPPRPGASQSIAQMRDSLDSSYARGSYTRPADTSLEPLGESVEEPVDRAYQSRDSAQLESFLSPTFGTFNSDNGNKALTRSTSVTQMRDLKHQMKDLKGKISSLREQARVDSMKRRSLQSLRTPSPFTYARVDQWYADPQPNEEIIAEENRTSERYAHHNGEVSVEGEDDEVYRDIITPTAQILIPNGSGLAQSTASHSSSTSSKTDTQTTHEAVAGARSDGDIHSTKLSYPQVRPYRQDSTNIESSIVEVDAEDIPDSDAFVDAYDVDDMRTEDGWDEDDAATPTAKAAAEGHPFRGGQLPTRDSEEPSGADYPDGGYESESGESLYHDTVQHQISHEDREDAFDYEHFILHSALGTISQQRLTRNGRSDSFSSEDSVETTRGPAIGNNTTDSLLSELDRRASMSSIESFATATEGRLSRAKQGLSDEDREEAIEDETASGAGPASASTSPTATAGGGEERPGKMAAKSAAPTAGVPAGASTAAVAAHGSSAEEPRQAKQPIMAQRPSSSAATPGHRPSVASFESTGTTRSFPLVSRSRLFGSSGSNGSNGSSRGATPSGRTSSDNEELRSISQAILDETASICDQATSGFSVPASPCHKRPRSLDSQTSELNLNSSSNSSSNSNTNLGLQDRVSSNSSSRPGTGVSIQTGKSQALKALSREDQFLVERLVGSLGQCVLGLSEHGRASVESRICRRRLEAAQRILDGLGPV